MSLFPELAWAQRKDRLLIRIKVKNCADADVKFFAEGRISFKGTSRDSTYSLELDLLQVCARAPVQAPGVNMFYACATVGYQALREHV